MPTILYLRKDLKRPLSFGELDANFGNLRTAVDGKSLAQLVDVNLTSLAGGNTLQFNSVTQKWENVSASGAYILNQYAAAQPSSQFWTSGNGRVGGKLRVDGDLGIGIDPLTNIAIQVQKNVNSTVAIRFENTNTGGNAFTALQFGQNISSGNFMNMGYGGTGVAPYGVYQPNGTFFFNNGTGGLNLGTSLGGVTFFVGGPEYGKERVKIGATVALEVIGEAKLSSYPSTRADGTSTKFLYTDGSGNVKLGSLPAGTFDSPLTFSNGLIRTANAVKWGGTLTQDTNILTGPYTYTLGTNDIYFSASPTQLTMAAGDALGNSSSFNVTPTLVNLIGNLRLTSYPSSVAADFSPGNKFLYTDSLGNLKLGGIAPGTYESPLSFTNGLSRAGNTVTLGGGLNQYTEVGAYDNEIKFNVTGFGVSVDKGNFNSSTISMGDTTVVMNLATGAPTAGVEISGTQGSTAPQLRLYSNNSNGTDGSYFQAKPLELIINTKSTSATLLVNNLPTGATTDDLMLITSGNQVKRIPSSNFLTTTQASGIYIPLTEKAAVNGVATLDGFGKIPTSQLPALAITDVYVVADLAARDALTVQQGDVAKVLDTGAGYPGNYIYDGSTWVLLADNSNVNSVNGYTGNVTLTTSDIAEGTRLYYTDTRARNAISLYNGLTYDPATGIGKLGGALPEDTTISVAGGKRLMVSGASATMSPMQVTNSVAGGHALSVTAAGNGNGLVVSTSSGYAIFSSVSDGGTSITSRATNGMGVDAYSKTGYSLYGRTDSGTPLYLSANPATTNAGHTMVNIIRTTTGVAANGIGAGISTSIQTSDGVGYQASNVLTKWTEATTSGRTSQYEIWLTNNVVNGRKWALAGDGTMYMDGYGTGTKSGTPVYNLQVDATGKVIETLAVATSNYESPLTFTNGLTRTGNNVVLGGMLSQNTTITTGTNSFSLIGSGSYSTLSIQGSNVGTAALYATSNGPAMQGRSANGYYAAQFEANASTTNTVIPVLNVMRTTTGTGANGIGAAIDMYVQNSTQTEQAVRLTAKYSDATARTSFFELELQNNSARARKLGIAGDGTMFWDGYGTGAKSGTPVYNLQVDSTGKVIETPVMNTSTYESPLTFGNGLTRTGNNVIFGGTLSQNVNMQALGFSTSWTGALDNAAIFIVQNTGTNGGAFSGSSVSGTAISGGSTSGYGGYFTSSSGVAALIGTNTNMALDIYRNDPSTNTVVTVQRIRRLSSGTAADGIGAALDFHISNNGGSAVATQLSSIWTSALVSTRTSQFEISGWSNNSYGRKFAIAGSGQLILDGYTTGSTLTGTPAYNLQVDATGKVIIGTVPVGNYTDTSARAAISLTNGLTYNSTTGVGVLGGTLTQTTTINTAGFGFNITSTTGTTALNVTNTSIGTGLAASAQTGAAVYGNSNSGYGIWGASQTSIGGVFNINPTSTNNLAEAARLYRTTSGTVAANGIGTFLGYYVETDDGGAYEAGRLAFKWTDVALATRSSMFELHTTNNTTVARKMGVAADGTVTWDAYNSSRNDGAVQSGVTKLLYVDSTGKMQTGVLDASGIASGSTNYIQNQIVSAQSANFWITGTGVIGSSIKFPGTYEVALTNNSGALDIAVSGQTAHFRLLPWSNDIWFQNTLASGGINFSAPGGADLTGNVLFRTTGMVGVGANTPLASLHVGTNRTASSGYARGFLYNGTLTAAANNDILVGVDVAPTFVNGSFTGVKNYGIRTSGDSYLGGSITFQNSSAQKATLIVQTAYTTTLLNDVGQLGNFTVNTLDASSFRNNANLTIDFDNNGLNPSSVFAVQQAISTATPKRFFQIFGTTGDIVMQNGGTFIDAGYRLDVQGTFRATGSTTLTTLAGTGNRLVQADPNGVLSASADVSTFSPASGSTNYIQNQTAVAQAASFKVSGSGTVGGALVVGGAAAVMNSGLAVLAAGTNTVLSVGKTLFKAMFVDYVIFNGTNQRAGTVIINNNGTTATFSEMTSSDIGNTSSISTDVTTGTTNVDFKFSGVPDGTYSVTVLYRYL